MKLRSAQIGRPTWREAAEATLAYAEEALREHAPNTVVLTFEPVVGTPLPTYQLIVRDAK